MSVTGQIFTNQELTAAQHRTLLDRLFGDGIVEGCDMRASGYDLFIAPGLFISAGGIQNILASEQITFNQTYGYARVVSQLDMTATATDDTWEQQSWIVEYAASPDDFEELVQEDINTDDGEIYQIEFCVVQLSTSGITAIIRRLAIV